MNQVLCVHLGTTKISLEEVTKCCSFIFFRHRDYPMMSSSRNGGYSSGGGPDRSYPSMRSSYMDSRSRPYDSPYERQRMPPPPMNYPDPYSRSGGDPYARDDYYHRGPPLPMDHHYGRGPPMRYVDLR